MKFALFYEIQFLKNGNERNIHKYNKAEECMTAIIIVQIRIIIKNANNEIFAAC